jgi:glyoxylase-like metal-dependent hydrolase (beta-lactamase superfamily II)
VTSGRPAPLGSQHVDVNSIEIIPTPGHSPGSTCYLVNGAEGAYLFTGDTLVYGDGGNWWAGYIPGIADADALADSLRLLRTLNPDVVISSAFQGDSAVHRIQPGRWMDHIDEALKGLSTSSPGYARTASTSQPRSLR